MPDVCIPYKLFQNLIQWYKKVFQTIKYLFCCSTHPQTLRSIEQETMKIAKKTPPPFNTTPKVADGPPGYPRKFFGMLSLASRVQKSNIKTFEFELRFIEHVKVQKNALFSKKTPPLKFDKFHNYLKWYEKIFEVRERFQKKRAGSLKFFLWEFSKNLSNQKCTKMFGEYAWNKLKRFA